MPKRAVCAVNGLESLTPRQREIYNYFRDYIRLNGKPPTIRVAAAALGLRSVNGLTCHLLALERKQVIAREANSSRGVRLLVEEPITADLAGGVVTLDCGDRVYYLDREGAERLGQTLLRLATLPATLPCHSDVHSGTPGGTQMATPPETMQFSPSSSAGENF